MSKRLYKEVSLFLKTSYLKNIFFFPENSHHSIWERGTDFCAGVNGAFFPAFLESHPQPVTTPFFSFFVCFFCIFDLEDLEQRSDLMFLSFYLRTSWPSRALWECPLKAPLVM